MKLYGTMKKQSPIVEWHYLDSPSGEEAWAQYVSGEQSRAPTPAQVDAQVGWRYDRRLRTLLAPLSIVLCLFAAGTGLWLWRSAQSGLAKIRQEIQLTAMAELGECVDAAVAARQAPRLDPQATNEPRRSSPPLPDFCRPWRQALEDFLNHASLRPEQQLALQMTVEEVDLTAPFALVTVELSSPELPSVPEYRSALVFQQQERGWRYSSGGLNALWGTPRQLNTPLLRVEFHDRDAAEVTAVAERLALQYAAWRSSFGLVEAVAEPIVIRAAPAFAEPDEEFWSDPPNELVIPSPLLLVRRAEEPTAALFEERASRFLLLHVIDEAMRTPSFLEEQTLPEHWQIMVDGFYFSLERTRPAVEPHKQVQELDLPLSLITFGPGTTQTVFTNTSSPDSERGWIVFSRPSLNYPGKYWAAESVAEYILRTYPPEQIATMLRALPRHESWDTLAPAVFGVDAATFQAQWREYVTTHYPLQ